MGRIKLKSFNIYPFTTTIPVRITDVNYGGHLGNDTLLSLIHEARVSFLKEHRFTEKDCAGVALIMGDAVVVYQGEAFSGDLLRFEVRAGEPTGNGFRLFYRVTRPVDNKNIALVETGMVCYDYDSKKLCRLPEAVRTICQNI